MSKKKKVEEVKPIDFNNIEEVLETMHKDGAFEQLSFLVSRTFGLKGNISLYPKIEEKGKKKIVIESEDLIGASGIMANALRELRIESFGSGLVTEKKDKDGELDPDAPYYWTRLNFAYRHIGGGQNGCDTKIRYAKYVFARKLWAFEIQS